MGAPVRQTSVKGQVAFTKIKVLDNNENTSSAKTVHVSTYYDNKYRAIQVKRDLFDGNTTGKSTISTNFAFDGNPERIREKQVFYGQINTANTRYTYDHARRSEDIYHRMNSAAEWLISTTNYDGIGRAKTKKTGNNELVKYA